MGDKVMEAYDVKFIDLTTGEEVLVAQPLELSIEPPKPVGEPLSIFNKGFTFELKDVKFKFNMVHLYTLFGMSVGEAIILDKLKKIKKGTKDSRTRSKVTKRINEIMYEYRIKRRVD